MQIFRNAPHSAKGRLPLSTHVSCILVRWHGDLIHDESLRKSRTLPDRGSCDLLRSSHRQVSQGLIVVLIKGLGQSLRRLWRWQSACGGEEGKRLGGNADADLH